MRSCDSARSGTKCGGLCEAWYDSENGTVSPSPTVNEARVEKSWLFSGMAVCNSTASGPQTAESP